MFAFTFNSQGQKRFLVAAPDGEQGFFCHNPVPAAAFIPRCPRGNPPGARWPSLLSCAATGRSPAAPRPPRGSGLGISMSGAGWSQAAEEGAGTWERKSKPVRRSCIYFFLCHADVKRTVIYSGISVILGILEIFAVSQGIVGIRGVFSNKFLAMSKKGKLHASARFTVDCHFRERFQENSYNTYASAVHRSPRSGRQWYVALNKRGKAKRGCSPRARPQHVSTHFLPRFGQPQPPELAFTVALPEKKPPPPKPKAAPSPPRKSPGPARYRLKFRFG
uniref:Fibroblast growth factor n=1 Tax=Serinus canaria TaxID=9135 RepID=A0A8C9U7K6_SERCA